MAQFQVDSDPVSRLWWCWKFRLQHHIPNTTAARGSTATLCIAIPLRAILYAKKGAAVAVALWF
jgi:hypothetical protein